MSKRWFDGLPEDEKALLTRLPAEPTRDARARLRAMRPTLRAELERRGVRVHTPSKADRRAMKGPLRKVAPELAGALSPAASALLRAARGSR
jgi:TRAP-type C4-dicarboxylate transport system substrate-binding protein